MRTRLGAAGIAVFLLGAMLTAQIGQMTGVVRDSDGGTLPGVAVEVSSAALVEKVRTTSTDQNGRYQFAALPVGTYTVTFGLQGFATLKRELVPVTADFTAAVNAEMTLSLASGNVIVRRDPPPVLDPNLPPASSAADRGVCYGPGIFCNSSVPVFSTTPGIITSHVPAFVRITPEQVKWIDEPGGLGVQRAVMQGDPSRPGIYVVRFRFPKGVMSNNHFHGDNRHAVVIQGTWWTGTGAEFTPGKTVGLKAGSYMLHPAGEAHFDGAKDRDVIVQIVGYGPSETTMLRPQEPVYRPSTK